MGKRVRKQFAHQLPLEQLHQKLQQQADAESGSSSSAEQIHFQRDGDRYIISGSYSGFSIKGAVVLAQETLSIEIELPMLAGLFQGKVERYINEQAKALLG